MNRLVILRALGLGDLLTAFPALRALRRAFPEHRRILAAPAPLEWLARASGAVDEVVDVRAAPPGPGCGLRPPEPLPSRLHGAEVAVNLHGCGPECEAVLRAAEPKRLIAFGADVPWREDEHEVQRWCRLLAGHGIAADPGDLDLELAMRHLPPMPGIVDGATVIHAGAGSAARRWPLERWAAVARAEREDGRTVVLTGSGREILATAEIARAAGLHRASNFTGRTGLRGLSSLVARAGRVVCADTGVAHLATALGTPSVVLFGPDGPARWGPPVDRPWHRALWAGRRGDPHGTESDPGIMAIDVEQVREALALLPTREHESRRATKGASHALG